MPHRSMQIETQNGRCLTHAYYPDGAGPWPGVLLYMDGIGMRPALMEMAERLAGGGYYVLLPDLFYRIGYTADGMNVFTDPAVRADWLARVIPAASPANVMRDTEAFLAHLDAEPNVKHGGIGITGYCMGGRLALYAAGHFGDRVVAAASYHSGNLATDAPDSPHRLAPQMTARIYVAGAIEDRGFDDAQKDRLERALTEAGVDHTIETYNARHGWVPRDTPVHDPAATERHWRTLFDLFGRALGDGRPPRAET